MAPDDSGDVDLRIHLYPEFKVQNAPPSFASLALTSLLLIFTLGLVAVIVSWCFGWLSFENYNTRELTQKISQGRPEVGELAAVDWSTRLVTEDRRGRHSDSSLKPDRSETEELGNILNQRAVQSHPGLLSALAVILGHSSEIPVARQALLDFLARAFPPGEAEAPELQALLSLGKVGIENRAQLDVVLSRIQSADPRLRKTAAFVLGELFSAKTALNTDLRGQATEALVKLLNDEVPDVRWNSTFALARLGDGRSIPVLRAILLEAKNTKEAAMDPVHFELYIAALRASGSLKSPVIKNIVDDIAQDHPNLKIRELAKEERY